jgi:hypothetical protein
VVADFTKSDTVQTKIGTVQIKIGIVHPKFDEKKSELVRSDFFQPVEFLNTVSNQLTCMRW